MFWLYGRKQQLSDSPVFISLLCPCRFPSFQQWAHFCHALRYGHQVLQRTRPSFPHEEGVIAAVEEHSGENFPTVPLSVCLQETTRCTKLMSEIPSPVSVYSRGLRAAPEHQGWQARGTGPPPSPWGQYSSHSQHEGCFSSSFRFWSHRTAAKACPPWTQGRVLKKLSKPLSLMCQN